MINHVLISGTLLKDPEIRDGARGSVVAEFTLVHRSARWDPDTRSDVVDRMFVRVLAWNDAAAVVARIGQGATVLVTGEISQREVELANGRKDRKTKIKALVVQVVNTPVREEDWSDGRDDEYPG